MAWAIINSLSFAVQLILYLIAYVSSQWCSSNVWWKDADVLVASSHMDAQEDYRHEKFHPGVCVGAHLLRFCGSVQVLHNRVAPAQDAATETNGYRATREPEATTSHRYEAMELLRDVPVEVSHD